MIQFPIYPGLPFDAYTEAVGRCRDKDKKKELDSMKAGMKECYDEYDNCFNAKSVHTLTPHKVSEKQADYLKSLYRSNATICKNIRKHINSHLSSRVYWDICPYCTVEGGKSIEHIMPKEIYPEYSIHAHNLIPCCTICNSNKGTAIVDEKGVPHFLNFFYHNPDSFEFLRADVSLDKNGYPRFEFKLEFPQGCDVYMKKVISNHFQRFHLKDKYETKVISKYPEEEVKILDVLVERSVEDTISKIQEWVTKYTPMFGKNHYYVAMLRALATSPIYHAYLASKKSAMPITASH